MCIVIDTNTFCCVFDKRSHNFSDFKPVNEWIMNGKGFVVYGGTKYKEELKKAKTYLGLFTELKRARKAIEVNEQLVNDEQRIVEGLESNSAFNDAHIIAIFRVSWCKLLCSLDTKADRFIKKKTLYKKGQKKPAIYRYRAHIGLLCDTNIVSIRNAI